MNATQTIVMGRAAGNQFENSDTAYVGYEMLSQLISWPNALLGVVTLGLLAAIWFIPFSKVVKQIGSAGLALVLFSGAATPALAYYDKTDWSENVFILPNESAFFIPDVGANKDSQTKFGSQEYFEANKIAAKRFNIPHTKLSNSGSWSDYYVPAGRLIIVDRSPFNKEWTGSTTRGTSAKDQSFPCQSKEGLDISVGMAIGTSVQEENASKFLYRFGVNPPAGDRNRPEVIFQSVFQGKSLGEVMDGPVRNKIQSLVCDEFTARSFNDDSAKALEIRKAIEVNVGKYLTDYGITLDFIGWADTFTFSKDVQKAIDDLYVAQTIAPVLVTLQAQADIKVKEGLADGLRNHGLPANLVTLPTDLVSGFTSMLGTKMSSAPTKP